jgi:hypothetical protein
MQGPLGDVALSQTDVARNRREASHRTEIVELLTMFELLARDTY